MRMAIRYVMEIIIIIFGNQVCNTDKEILGDHWKKGQITVLDNHSLHTPTTRNNFVPLKSTTEKGILPLSLIQRKLSQVLIIQQATVSFLMVAESKVKQR